MSNLEEWDWMHVNCPVNRGAFSNKGYFNNKNPYQFKKKKIEFFPLHIYGQPVMNLTQTYFHQVCSCWWDRVPILQVVLVMQFYPEWLELSFSFSWGKNSLSPSRFRKWRIPLCFSFWCSRQKSERKWSVKMRGLNQSKAVWSRSGLARICAK